MKIYIIGLLILIAILLAILIYLPEKYLPRLFVVPVIHLKNYLGIKRIVDGSLGSDPCVPNTPGYDIKFNQ